MFGISCLDYNDVYDDVELKIVFYAIIGVFINVVLKSLKVLAKSMLNDEGCAIPITYFQFILKSVIAVVCVLEV